MAKQEKGTSKKYELMVIVKATLPDTQKKAVLKKITDQVKEMGGSIEEENIWGKRYMAFPIKKHQEGYYVIYNIQLSANETKEFGRQLTLNSDILRYLMRTVDQFEKISIPGENTK